MENIIKLRDGINDTLSNIRKGSEDYIRKTLEKYNGKIDFTEFEDVCIPSISYDGGNHPEYDSNLYSSVYGAFINKDGNICFEMEDCEEYDISRLMWDEVFTIAEFMYEDLGL